MCVASSPRKSVLIKWGSVQKVYPECASVVCGFFSAKGSQDPVGSRETTPHPHNYLENLEFGALPRMRDDQR